MTTLAPVHIMPLLELYCLVRSEDMPHCKRLMTITPDLADDINGNKGEALVQHKTKGSAEECIWELTERGRIYVEALIETALPEQVWMIPNQHEVVPR